MTNGAGALLARSGLIEDHDLRRAREARAVNGGTLGEHLVLFGLTDDEELTRFYHSRLMVPRVDPNQLARIPRRIIAKIPADMATEFRLIPVNVDRDQNLTVVMSDPSDTHAIDEIGFFTGCYVMRAVATQRQIAWCLAHYYGYVSPLGETLLESVDGEAGPDAPVPPTEPEAVPARRRGPGPITREVEAARHKVRPPPADTGPVQAVELVADLPDDDIVELGQPMTTPKSDSGPTGPIRRRTKQKPNPPELGPRVGEVEVRDELDATPSSSREALPAVVISVGVEDDPIATIEETDEEDEVVILDRPRSDSDPPVAEAVPEPRREDEISEVVVLDSPKSPRRRRTSKRTRMGLGIVAAEPRPATDADAEAAAAGEPDTAPAIPRLVTAEASPEPIAPDITDGVPVPVSDQAATEANSTAPFQRIDYDEDAWGDDEATGAGDDDDEPEDELESSTFGPPGTTIPPAYLGAMPDTENTGPHNAIPLNVPDDESGAVSAPVPRPADPVVAMAGDLTEIADGQRELEDSAMRLVGTLRALDAATTRDAIVEALLDHLVKTFARATFFVVRGGDLAPFRSKGAGAIAANWKNSSLDLAVASTFRDVVQARLPFRGRVPDEPSQAFAARVFGHVPDEMLLVPCSVRERPIGLLCGTGRTQRIFHEHLSVVTRGAGEAFERILKQRKGTES